MVKMLSEHLNKHWGFSGIVGEWNFTFGLEGNFTVHNIQENYENWLTECLDNLKKLNSVQKLVFSLSEFDKDGNEINFYEDEDYHFTGEFSLHSFVAFLKSTYNNPYLTNLNFGLATKVISDRNQIIVEDSAELMISFDSDFSFFIKSPNFYCSYTTYIDVWMAKTYDENKRLRKNEFSIENLPRVNELIRSFANLSNSTFVSCESHYYKLCISDKGVSDNCLDQN